MVAEASNYAICNFENDLKKRSGITAAVEPIYKFSSYLMEDTDSDSFSNKNGLSPV